MLAREIFQDDKYVENLKNKLESAEDKRKVLLATSFFLVLLGIAVKRVSRARECSKVK